ncbi:hypothetical protein EDB89DRAFT_1911939 [Lactarius sanguifluus]|nr:hypothetical protein EDB89DRAFT_1911939 [Lactarius sanguifluus]
MSPIPPHRQSRHVTNPATPIPPHRQSRRVANPTTSPSPAVPTPIPSATASSPAASSRSWSRLRRRRRLRAADSRRYCAVVVSLLCRGRTISHGRTVAPWSYCHAVVVPSCRGHTVAPWSYRHAIVTPSLRHRSESCKESSCGLHHATCRMRRHVGLALEWWWWLAVPVHMWEWRRWWASVEVGGSHRQRHTQLRKKKGLAEAESVAWETVLCSVGKPNSTSPPPPPPCSTQAHGSRLQRLPRTSPPPPPPLTACKSCRNATPTWRATPTATTPTTTVMQRREQHGGRNDGDGDVVVAGMAAAACRERWQRSGNDGGGVSGAVAVQRE